MDNKAPILVFMGSSLLALAAAVYCTGAALSGHAIISVAGLGIAVCAGLPSHKPRKIRLAGHISRWRQGENLHADNQ